MTNKWKYIIAASVLILFLFIIGFIGYMANGSDKDSYRVSVLVEAKSQENWSVLRQGMEDAAKELNIEVNYITVNNTSKASECMDAIKREILNGSDGLILNLPYINRLVRELDSMAVDTKIVMVESEIPVSKGFTYISPDNYQMGYDLGKVIMRKKQEGEGIGIVVGSVRKTANVERKNGILDAIGEENISWIWEGSKDVDSEDIRQMMSNNNVDYIVGLDSSVTEEIIDVVDENKPGSVFGIGNTEKMVYYLDKGVIDTLIAPNEYIMGYQSVKNMYHRLRFENQVEGADIDYLIVNKKNLYSEDCQKIMFPMVQ